MTEDGLIEYMRSRWSRSPVTESLLPYYRRDVYWFRHHKRYEIGVALDGLLCQECGGGGTINEVVLEDGSGPTYDCGWCEGTGLMTRWERGQWLKYKREDARRAREELRKIV